MNDTFHKLPEGKKKAILDACMIEFARYGYENASTNRIVREIGISKGSLFLYFNTKDDLYLSLLEDAASKVLAALLSRLTGLPRDILDRVRAAAMAFLDVRSEEPARFRLFASLFDCTPARFQEEIAIRFSREIFNLMKTLFAGIDTGRLRHGLDNTVEALKWVLDGLNRGMENADEAYGEERARQSYLARLDLALSMLSGGIYSQEARP